MTFQLLSENRDIRRCLDAQTNLVALDLDNRDRNLRPDHDLLRQLSAQNQHFTLLAIPR